MDIANLSSRTIRSLFKFNLTSPAVTIYMPTHRSASPPNMSQDEIRFKNLHAKTVKILKSREDSRQFTPEIDDLLTSISNKREFWEFQTEGLLICARPGQYKLFHLPFECQEYISVSDQFHLAPIFGILNDLQKFYVLIVTQHLPSLLIGDFYGIKTKDLKLPESIETGLKIDEMGQENEQQVSSYSNGNGYNGRGGFKNPAEEERQRFWRVIDSLVREHTNNAIALILAGIESEISEFRAISRYPNILDSHIEGSYSGAKANDIFMAALSLFSDTIIKQEHDQVISEYKELAGQSPSMVGHDIATIDKAAAEGRIKKLLLAGINYTTDTIRDNKDPVAVLQMPSIESAQAVNEIARTVFNSSGRIINIEQRHMPVKGAQILAIMRY